VCDDHWDDIDARVVCNQLGIPSTGMFYWPSYKVYHLNLILIGAVALRNGRFGQESGDFLLDDVQCVGSESRLIECPAEPIGIHNCLHDDREYAAAGCELIG
jgi:hypothetical protein